MSATEIMLLSPVLPLIASGAIALLRYRHLSKASGEIAKFIFVTVIAQFSSLYLWFREVNNMPVLHVYTALGFIFLARFYEQVFRGFIPQSWFRWMTGMFIAFAMLNTLVFQSLLTFNSNALILQGIFMTILSMSYYAFLLKRTSNASPRSYQSMNWFNSGLFVYHVSTILLFYHGKVIIDNFEKPVISRYAWLAHSLFASVLYLCLGAGLWIRQRK